MRWIFGLLAVLATGCSVGRLDPGDVAVTATTLPAATTTTVPATTTTVPATTTTTLPRPVTTMTTTRPVVHVAPRPPVTHPTTSTTPPPTVLSIAESQVGKTGSYATGGFWCAKFVSWVEDQAHTPNWVDETSPSVLEGDAKAEGRYTTTPAPGELAFMDLTSHGGTQNPATHVGFVLSVDGATVTTIEGNADGSGTVTVQHHTIGDYLYGFGRW